MNNILYHMNNILYHAEILDVYYSFLRGILDDFNFTFSMSCKCEHSHSQYEKVMHSAIMIFNSNLIISCYKKMNVCKNN